MNSFVNSPFLFFVDNAPPIFADNSGENQRKIIEISDVGCDAITPIMSSQNNPTRTTTPKNSRRYEEKPMHNFYREKWRQNEEVAKNLGKTFSTPKHVGKDHRLSTDEHRWNKPTAHNEVIDTPTSKKPPNTKDIKTSPRMPPERPRLNRWNRGNVQENPLYLPYDHAAANSQRRPMSCPTRKRPITPQSPTPKTEPKINATIVPKIEENSIFDKRNTMVALELDYPEVFDHSVSEDRWQNPRTTSRNLKTPIDEALQKTQRPSRYQKTTRTASAKANNPEQTIEDSEARKIRSRTRSPPSDRRKSTQSYPKSPPKDLEQAENQQKPQTIKDPKSSVHNFNSDQSGSLDRARSVEKIRRFVDRGVDRDSICDILNVSTSTDATLAPTSSSETGKSEKIIGFWEFIPLEDENDPRRKIAGNRKNRCLLDRRMFQDNDYHPLRRQLVNENDYQGSVKESSDRHFVSENTRRADHCPLRDPGDPETMKEDTDSSRDVYRREESRSVEVLDRTRLNSEVNKEYSREKLCSYYDAVANEGKHDEKHDRSWVEPKHQPKSAHTLGFEWQGKNRHPKIENDAKHGDECEKKKKKKKNEEKISGLKLIEKTAACLKRKLEGSQKEGEVGKSWGLNIEKKIRSEVTANSKLPIRIGKRLKSKNPVARKLIDSLKSRLPDKKDDEDPEHINAVRSRTKPRIKPSVELHRIVVYSDDTPACPMAVDNVRTAGRVEDQCTNGWGEKLGERLKYAEQDSRRKEFANRFYAKGGQGNGMTDRMDADDSRNSWFKEKCFFHVHDQQNRICNQYCKRMPCGKVCQ